MNIWLRFWIFWAVLTFALWLNQPVYGQTATGNLINPAGTAWGIPSNQVLNSAGIAAAESGGMYVPGSPYYNSDTNTIRFSYLPGTVAQSIAINSALAGTGIKWVGYDYSWQIQNAPGQNGGQLSATISLNGNNGKALESYFYNYPQGITPQAVWLTDSGRKLFSQSGGYTIGQVSSLDITWSGQDSLFWMGLYGPRVRDTDVRLLYDVDQCPINPLSDPSCPGYAAALLSMQCSANPLIDPSCPGYAQALFTQQCSANPLHNAACPGYQQAYFNQQCSANPLYDRSCPGYNTAYATQQASQTNTVTSTSTSSTTTVSVTGTVSTTEPTITIATDGTVTTGVATVPEAEVNAVVTRQIPSTASPTGTVTIQVQTKPQEETEEERRRRLRAATDAEREIAMKEEKKREEEASERRRELAARMRAAAQEAAVNRGREAIRDADRAQTMEQQVANQALIVATMNFVPGFESYGVARLPDSQFYRPRDIYPGQQPVDNRRLLRGLTGASDQRHADMVNSQYGR